ncbi:MAG: B12-binding domain-containing radical SAM protein [Planctomycetes bacterium]|nr:B12-binding domain-containing radical SAM protein [Planctomycetota bacterium]
MKVLLINPSYDIKRYMGKLSKIAFVFQPIGLTYIAAYLRSKEIEANIHDSQIETKPIQEVVREYDPDIIGITCVTFLVYSTIELSKLLKTEFPDKIIIVGGIHPTIRPKDFLQEQTVDYVAVGEGEITMYEFVRAIESGQDPASVPGIMCMRSAEIVAAPQRQLIDNLDDLPAPDIDDLVQDGYQTSIDTKTGDKIAVILTSRGCPFNCIFCANQLLTKGKYRSHSIERVCNEIDNLIRKRNISQLFIMDDNFAVNKKRAKELCREFIRRGFHSNVSWWAEARIDCVDQELLSLMRQANCRIISYGLESGNQRLLDYIEKGITLEQIREAIAQTKKAGIDIRATFILGLPTETREESLRTIKFARELGIDQVRFSLATPFPGTKLWDAARAEGTLDFTDWQRFSMMAGYSKGLPCYAPKGRDPKELVRLQRRANLMFFLTPRVIGVYLRRMTNLRSFLDISFGAMKFIRASLFPDR